MPLESAQTMKPKDASKQEPNPVMKRLAGIAASSEQRTLREEYLKKASKLVAGTRDKAYGSPAKNLGVQAEFITTYFRQKYGLEHTFSAGDVAAIMLFVKLGRHCTSPEFITDTMEDLLGYGAIMAELETPA